MSKAENDRKNSFFCKDSRLLILAGPDSAERVFLSRYKSKIPPAVILHRRESNLTFHT